MEVVKVEGLCKQYARGEYAVEDLSFCCMAGEITGLLGHNGVGKSTTLKCVEGMLPYERGTLEVCGHDLKKDGLRAKAETGFVTDDHAVFEKMTGLQYLGFLADIYGVESDVREKRYRALEEVFCLGDAVRRLISTYSHGMRQKICMMGSLLHRPKLWILDEPMTGLDPRTSRAVQEFMRAYAAEGNAVLFSSHALDIVSKVCDRVVVLRKGRRAEFIDMRLLRDRASSLEERFFRES